MKLNSFERKQEHLTTFSVMKSVSLLNLNVL